PPRAGRLRRSDPYAQPLRPGIPVEGPARPAVPARPHPSHDVQPPTATNSAAHRWIEAKTFKRVGRGYRNHDNYRCRIMAYTTSPKAPRTPCTPLNVGEPRKRRYVCAEELCPRGTFTEITDQLPARARLTTRLAAA